MKSELIFMPVPGPTHLVSTIEFANLLLDRDDQICITILLITVSQEDISTSLTDSNPRIQLVKLPQVEPPPVTLLRKSFEAYFTTFIESHLEIVRTIISGIVSSRSESDSVRVVGLVVDFFCVSMIDVAKELDLPSYIFLTTNAGFLSLMLHLPTRHSEISSEFHDSDPELLISGFVNPVPPRVLLEALHKDVGYAAFVKLAQKFKDAKGIIVNTFTELESTMLDSFSGGGSGTPSVYPVGPIVQTKGIPNSDLDRVQCDKMMKWLDDQPDSSVVFLCFGSMGGFDAPQVKELAVGLENSGFRFLWSLRFYRPLDEELAEPGSGPNTKPEEMLPDGFLDRIEGRGMILSGWVPQMEVLAHKAVGGFVSHCGWNSISESLWCGVPIATWPLYAEQKLNAFIMVKELGISVELRGDRDVVMADEVERAVKCLMDGDNQVREKVRRMSKMAKNAVMEGGSSFNSLGLLIKDITSSSF